MPLKRSSTKKIRVKVTPALQTFATPTPEISVNVFDKHDWTESGTYIPFDYDVERRLVADRYQGTAEAANLLAVGARLTETIRSYINEGEYVHVYYQAHDIQPQRRLPSGIMYLASKITRVNTDGSLTVLKDRNGRATPEEPTVVATQAQPMTVPSFRDARHRLNRRTPTPDLDALFNPPVVAETPSTLERLFNEALPPNFRPDPNPRGFPLIVRFEGRDWPMPARGPYTNVFLLNNGRAYCRTCTTSWTAGQVSVGTTCQDSWRDGRMP